MKLKTNSIFILIVLLLFAGGLWAVSNASAGTMDIAPDFTYAGQLMLDDSAVNDACDFQFSLYDNLVGGNQIGNDISVNGTNVINGYFAVTLNENGEFGSAAFDGSARWLEIAVRCPSGSGTFTTLSPRQELTTVPFAAYSKTAPWDGLSGVPAGFADGVDNDTTYTAGDGLTLDGNQFNVVTTTVQTRIIDSCPVGSSIRVINEDGTVTCEVDNDTTYTAGDGLTLDGNQFNVVTTTVQTRIIDSCPVGSSIRVINEDGTVTCEVDDNTTTFWSLTGDSGVVSGTHFLGTTDNQALEMRVNNARALLIKPTDGSPNIIGGYGGNTAAGFGSTIGGGGQLNAPNRVTNDYGTVGGGYGNQADEYAVVAGGHGNTASGSTAGVLAGSNNTASGSGSVVLAGSANTASATGSAVLGGSSHVASGGNAVIAGGHNNAASGLESSIGGGGGNIASGWFATIPGGYQNEATGQSSFAAGQFAKARHNGSFVWNDAANLNESLSSTADNQFLVRASGGIWFGTTGNVASIPSGRFINTSTGGYLSTGGVWTNASDKNAKTNFSMVNPTDVLERVAQLPISTWNYKTQDATIRHMGPMAQDFYAAFGLGEDDKHLGTIDADGVALAAIQGLYQQNQALQSENAELKAQVDDLAARIAVLEAGPAPVNTLLWVMIEGGGVMIFLLTVLVGGGMFLYSSTKGKTGQLS